MTSPEHDKAQPCVLRVFQSKDETRAFYDKISKVYDVLAEHTEAPVRRAGLDMLAAGDGERILEIGSGTGHCLVDLARADSSQRTKLPILPCRLAVSSIRTSFDGSRA